MKLWQKLLVVVMIVLPLYEGFSYTEGAKIPWWIDAPSLLIFVSGFVLWAHWYVLAHPEEKEKEDGLE